MNRNNIDKIEEISTILTKCKNSEDVKKIIIEMLTESELDTLSKRWQILIMLKDGYTQREIAKELQVGLCKVTRGAQILKNKKSVVAKYLNMKGNNKNDKI